MNRTSHVCKVQPKHQENERRQWHFNQNRQPCKKKQNKKNALLTNTHSITFITPTTQCIREDWWISVCSWRSNIKRNRKNKYLYCINCIYHNMSHTIIVWYVIAGNDPLQFYKSINKWINNLFFCVCPIHE